MNSELVLSRSQDGIRDSGSLFESSMDIFRGFVLDDILHMYTGGSIV